MPKALNLVHVQQNGNIIEFYNKMDGRYLGGIELYANATYSDNTNHIFRVANCLEEYLEHLIDPNLPFRGSHRVLSLTTVVAVTPVHKTVHLVKGKRILARILEYSQYDTMNNLNLENGIAASCEDYMKAIARQKTRLKNRIIKEGYLK